MIKPQNYTLHFFASLLIFLSISTENVKSQTLERNSLTEEANVALANFSVQFSGDIHEKVKQCFLKVLGQYPSLHKYDIEVKRKTIKSSTMQAQPVFSLKGLFGGTPKYRIKLNKYVLDSDNIAIQDLPEEVIIGWFAHELGHLVDYETYSNTQMIWYGLKYLVSGAFRKQVEYEADYNALKSGFYDEVLASKRFLMNNDIGENYVTKIKQFYLSIEDIQAFVEDQGLLDDDEEDL